MTINYIIASTPRVGSNLLCQGLRDSKLVGNPGEYLAPDFRFIHAREWKLPKDYDFATFFRAAQAEGTANGYFGLKIQQMHLSRLRRDVGYHGRKSVLDVVFPHALYINLTRSDLRAQAISWYRALVTNVWWQTSKKLLTTPQQTPPFDPHVILGLEANLRSQQAVWDKFFKRKPANMVHRMTYETLDNNYAGSVNAVIAFLTGQPINVALPRSKYLRQSDETNLVWRRRLDEMEPHLERRPVHRSWQVGDQKHDYVIEPDGKIIEQR